MSARDHAWQDVALLPTQQGGAGWAAGLRYRCSRCGLERRVNHGGDKDGNAQREGASFIYFAGTKRMARAPECA